MDKVTKATVVKKPNAPVKAEVEVKPFTKAAQVQAHPRPAVKLPEKNAKAETKPVEKKPEPTPVQEEKVKAYSACLRSPPSHWTSCGMRLSGSKVWSSRAEIAI